MLDCKVKLMKSCKNIINQPRELYVDHSKNTGLDNVVMIMNKHTSKDDD